MRDSFRFSWLIGTAVVFSFGHVVDGRLGFDSSIVFAEEKGKSESRGNKDKDGNSGKSAESRGKNSTSSAHALYEATKDTYGFMNFGEFSSYLKSWRSAWRNPRAYEATMGNLNSLPGRQYAYGEAFVALQTAQSTYDEAFAACLGDPVCEADVEATEGVALATAHATAEAAFLATLPGNQTTIDPDFRALVDQIVVQHGIAGAEVGLY